MKAFHWDPPVRSLSLPTHFSELETSTVFLMAHILEMGGTQRQFAQLATALRRKRVRVRLGCNLSQGYFSETLRPEWEVTEFRLGDSLFSRKALSSARALARFLRSK